MQTAIRYYKKCVNCGEEYLTTVRESKFHNQKCANEHREKECSKMSLEEKSKMFGKRIKKGNKNMAKNNNCKGK